VKNTATYTGTAETFNAINFTPNVFRARIHSMVVVRVNALKNSENTAWLED